MPCAARSRGRATNRVHVLGLGVRFYSMQGVVTSNTDAGGGKKIKAGYDFLRLLRFLVAFGLGNLAACHSSKAFSITATPAWPAMATTIAIKSEKALNSSLLVLGSINFPFVLLSLGTVKRSDRRGEVLLVRMGVDLGAGKMLVSQKHLDDPCVCGPHQAGTEGVTK